MYQVSVDSPHTPTPSQTWRMNIKNNVNIMYYVLSSPFVDHRYKSKRVNLKTEHNNIQYE